MRYPAPISTQNKPKESQPVGPSADNNCWAAVTTSMKSYCIYYSGWRWIKCQHRQPTFGLHWAGGGVTDTRDSGAFHCHSTDTYAWQLAVSFFHSWSRQEEVSESDVVSKEHPTFSPFLLLSFPHSYSTKVVFSSICTFTWTFFFYDFYDLDLDTNSCTFYSLNWKTYFLLLCFKDLKIIDNSNSISNWLTICYSCLK